ncbi:alpha-hydroxy acid oxidase [Ignatzschineria cameli]|uniref:L-lactate dehydrogenase n=1 Tax=Ignatzschineria cameli TaxID=2182793 RepID=A0A2U2AL97_9GAMM|nr:alpha-hydroxy acid oxidase [Ignatzschineria cameli]PWD83642.1 L-lactate dehydrogenase [Ignatzschineria cameli]PWD83992.1 L-lactate dehydrogenase [Ignatzschineria cameli]PWD89001.1 L-lactate dehydrogenase [Ignatzschineria cameli]PWD90119.1 L-lactate dehydrogenase [Ignatzschineria cameli]PWD90782.1 L-lactate dehydrogenase [Ignatzschineria cameli]
MTTITNIEDLRVLAKRRVPKMFYDYVDSGSWTESTYRANESDFQKIKLVQKVARNMENRRLERNLLGISMSMPLSIAPTGLVGMVHPDGEILAARAAARFGIRYTLSTMSIASLEDIKNEVGEPFWFQLYVMRDRDFMQRLIDRAKRAGCDALVITLDLQMIGQRHKDLKNGLSVPPKPTLRNWLNLLTKQRWCWNMLKTKRRQFGNIVGHVEGIDDPSSLASWTNQQFDPTLNWDDIAWIKEMWGGKIILKGILDAEDAKLAHQVGADAIVVSNHGGRQLDGALSSIAVLPSIVEALAGTSTEIILDSGIRSGQDLLKAVALGANAGMIGRAYLYGLGAMGEEGVTKALELIRNEFETSMAFCGETDVDHVGRHILVPSTIPDPFR